ncbi:MAG TPA: hypothetical protein VJV79_35355 [Polyangiaceae bacterium]|nr:hypothetical protein [Polyangiaceae bacterium]
MQQTKAYWRFMAVAGVVGAFIASACVVTTGTDDNYAGASGSGTAGKGSSGAANSTAGASGAGTAGAGTASAGAPAAGAGQVSFQCDTGESGAPGIPNDCSPQEPGNECQECIQTSCCAQHEACYATSPGNQCGWGGPADGNGKGEHVCMHLCIQDGVAMGGTAPDEALIRTCGNACATPQCNGVLGVQTSDLIACQLENCSVKCFGG